MDYFKGRKFQKDIIAFAVSYYYRHSLGYRDLVEIMHDRGVSVSHTIVMRWVHHYGLIFRLLWCRHQRSASQSIKNFETLHQSRYLARSALKMRNDWHIVLISPESE